MSQPIGMTRGLALFTKLLRLGVGNPLSFVRNFMGYDVEHLGQLDQTQANATVLEAPRKVKQWHAERFEAERKRVEALMSPPVADETTPEEAAEVEPEPAPLNEGEPYDVTGLAFKPCRSCRTPIAWVETPKGKKLPVTRAGISHYKDCDDPKRFSKKAA